MSLSERHHAALLSAPWFAGLSELVRQDIVAHSRQRRLAAKERLYSRGDGASCMYGVIEGCIRASGISNNSRQTVLDFYGPGNWIGEVATLSGLPRLTDAQAYRSEAVVLQLSAENLNKLLNAHPTFCRALLQLEAQRLHIVLTAIEQYSVQTLEHRLANRLLMLMASFGVARPDGISIDLYLPQETLAELIGATRQRVNQILQTWETEAIVQQKNGQIHVLDEVRLREIAAG